MTFSSVSVTGLEDLVAKLQIALREIDDFIGFTTERSVRADMNRLDVTSAGFQDLEIVYEWVDSALQETQRRLGLARAMQRQHPNAPMVRIEENEVTDLDPALAERQGRDLAIRFEQAGGVDGDFAALMQEFEALAYDPDAMAGFYAELGPEMAARFAAALGMPESGVGENAQRYLELMSIGLGSALMDATPPDGLGAFQNEFGEATDDPKVAWGRLALLQYGDFSGSRAFAERTVNGTALDAFVAGGHEPGNIAAQSLTSDRTSVGLPSDIAALAFRTLSRDPELSRLVFQTHDMEQLVDQVDLTGMSPPDRHDVPEMFGLAIEAGVGADGDPPRTEHSPEENLLAFQFISAVGRHKELPPTLGNSLARIGAAYVDEIVAGSYIDGGERPGRREPSMTGAPPDFPADAGLSPSFYLSPDVVYRFMAGFQDTLETAKPFDDAMGRLMDEQLDAAMQADWATNPPGTRTQDLLRLFGATASLNFEARRRHAADWDATERGIRQAFTDFYTGGAGLIPTNAALHVPYWLFQLIGGKLLGNWVDDVHTEEGVVAENIEAKHMQWYLIAERLVRNGVGAEALASLPPELRTEDGLLRPMEEIFGDTALADEFYDWVNAQSGYPANPLNEGVDAGQQAWNDGAMEAQDWVAYLEPEPEN
ncbi:hypothetical protein [Jiangella rhizosphaerae]|nr:hypothetical protein [Jiangella rhizosphaerae]